MCTPLKHALVDHPEPAWRVAHQVGISEVRISKLSKGRATARDWEIAGLAEILGRNPQELFPQAADPVAI